MGFHDLLRGDNQVQIESGMGRVVKTLIKSTFLPRAVLLGIFMGGVSTAEAAGGSFREYLDEWKSSAFRRDCERVTITGTVVTSPDGGSPKALMFPLGTSNATKVVIWQDVKKGAIRQSAYADDHLVGLLERSAREVAMWSNSGVLTIDSPESTAPAKTGLRMFDLKLIGFASPQTQAAFGETFGEVEELLANSIKDFSVRTAAESGNTVLEFRHPWRTADTTYEAVEELELDPGKNFALVRRTMWLSAEGIERVKFLNVATSYEEKNGHWYPVRVRCDEGSEISEFGLAWEVDCGCPPEGSGRFIDTELPGDTLLADARVSAGPPVSLGRLGQYRSAEEFAKREGGFSTGRLTTIIILNLLAVGVLLVIWVVRRRARPTE